jgi:hypothetical protein
MGSGRAPSHHTSVWIDEKRAGYANAAEKVAATKGKRSRSSH